nr:glyoxalase family protein, expressed [Ipomoea batatas]
MASSLGAPAFAYTVVYCNDVAKSTDFYAKAFGYNVRRLEHNRKWAELESGSTTIAFTPIHQRETDGLTGQVETPQSRAERHPIELCFDYADVDAAFKRAVENGAVPVNPPEDKTWGQRVGYVRDIDGNVIYIYMGSRLGFRDSLPLRTMKTSLFLGSFSSVTENDFELTRRRALVHQRRGVVGVSESGRTSVLEELGVGRRLAGLRVIVVVSAAELVRLEGLAPALARNDRAVPAVGADLEACGTRVQKISPAPHDGALALAFVRGHRHGDVEPVHEADAVGREVGVAVVEHELG